MIYPSADKLNKIGSKYKLIAMAATRYKQLKAGMKPLIDTDSKNLLTVAFEEIAAGVITADIADVDELSIDYAEMARTASEFDADTNDQLKDVIKNNIDNIVTEKSNKTEIAESIKSEPNKFDDIQASDIMASDDDNSEITKDINNFDDTDTDNVTSEDNEE